MKHPWFKFNPTDWRADTALKMCSPVSRLLWLEMIGMMHEATPRGFFLVKGKIPTPQQLSGMLGLSVSDIKNGLKELAENEVYSTDSEGRIFSRRMVREEERSEIAKENAGARWGKVDDSNAICNAKPHAKKLEERRKKDSPLPPKGDAKAKKKPETGVPDGFPDAEALSDAKRLVVAEGAQVKIRFEADKFINHAVANDRRLRDWRAGWRNWILNAIDRAPKGLIPPTSAAQPINRWPSRVKEWKEDNYWNAVDWGPPPGEPGCLCPPNLLE